MRSLLATTAAWGAAGAAALLVAACGGDADDTENAGAEPLNAAEMLSTPANDASALESVAGTPEPAAEPVVNEAAGNEAVPVLGETSGGDTGGNTVESNVSGT